MIERQRVQHQIVGGDAGVDDAADILRDHRVVRQHRALRQRFRAAGVDDLRELVFREVRPPAPPAPVSSSVEAEHAGLALAFVLRRQPDQPLDRGVERRARRAPSRRARESVASSRAPACRRMNAASSAFSMKLIGTSTAPSRAIAKRIAAKACELRASMATRSPLPTPSRREPRREPQDDVVKLRVSPARLAADDRDLLRRARRAAPHEVVKGLAAGDGRHGVSSDQPGQAGRNCRLRQA